MNRKVICAFLGFVAILLGVGMLACTVWGLPVLGGGPEERHACKALYYSALICFFVGGSFTLLGRGYDTERLFLRESFACVSLCWFLAIFLGAIPYLLAGVQRAEGVPFTLGDAVFESASGLTTTGGTVFEDLENPHTLPRTILFWRSLTHFLGGLGVMCCFVVFLGKGVRGKAALKVERLFSGNLPFTKMRSLASSLCVIYLTICACCFAWFLTCGMTFYDAVSHAFSVAALGGFSTHNASAGYFARLDSIRHAPLEYGMIFFMILSGVNYWLLFWVSKGSADKLFKDAEWRFYIASLMIVAVLTLCLGLRQGTFVIQRGTREAPTTQLDEPEPDAPLATPLILADDAASRLVDASQETEEAESDVEYFTQWRESSHCNGCAVVCRNLEEAFRKALFHTASLMTSMGFATERYECWGGSTILLFMALMFIGGCSGSPAGGIKVSRALLALRLLRYEPEKHFRPNVVKITDYGGASANTETAVTALKYAAYLALLIVATTVVVGAIEPDSLWNGHNRPQTEKLFDIFGGSLAMFGNTGLAFGEFGSMGNYGRLTDASKLIFSWAMVVGRLEIWCILALFTGKFWSNR